MLLPIWDAAKAEIADGHALVGAYGPPGPPHGHVPANGSLFGEDCNNENEPNN